MQQWGRAIHQEWGPVVAAETPGWSTADDCFAKYKLPEYSSLQDTTGRRKEMEEKKR